MNGMAKWLVLGVLGGCDPEPLEPVSPVPPSWRDGAEPQVNDHGEVWVPVQEGRLIFADVDAYERSVEEGRTYGRDRYATIVHAQDGALTETPATDDNLAQPFGETLCGDVGRYITFDETDVVLAQLTDPPSWPVWVIDATDQCPTFAMFGGCNRQYCESHKVVRGRTERIFQGKCVADQALVQFCHCNAIP